MSADLTTHVADDGGSYRVERSFDAPAERVFDAFVEPDDLRVWFPAAAPPGSQMLECTSDPTPGAGYHYVLDIPEHGRMTWTGTYTAVERPSLVEAEEQFSVGDAPPPEEPARQRLTFVDLDQGRSRVVMEVWLAEPQDPTTLREQDLAGLAASLDAMAGLIEQRQQEP